MARNRIINLDDGDSIEVGDSQQFWLTCCDCSLTHRIEVKVSANKAELRITRDNRRTAQKRRRGRTG